MRHRIEEMLKEAKEYLEQGYKYDDEFLITTAKAKITVLTELLNSGEVGEAKQCRCGIDEMTFGSRMSGYELEIITKRMYQNMSPANRWYVTIYDFCSSCGGKIESSQSAPSKGETV